MNNQAIIPVAHTDVFIAGHPTMAVLLPDGQSGAILTSLCAILDLKPSTQAHLIRENPVLSEAVVQVALPSPGGRQTTNVLLAWAIALWAAGLNQGRRSLAYKELLLAIQREAGRRIVSQFAQVITSEAFVSSPAPIQSSPPQSGWQEGHNFIDHLETMQNKTDNRLTVLEYDLHSVVLRLDALEAGNIQQSAGLSDQQLGYIYRCAHQVSQRQGYDIDTTLAGLAAHFRVKNIYYLPESAWPAVLEWFSSLLEE